MSEPNYHEYEPAENVTSRCVCGLRESAPIHAVRISPTTQSIELARINKVTILIEDDEGNTTAIKVPHAEKLSVRHEPIANGEPHEMGKPVYFMDRVRLQMELTAMFDEAHDHIFAIDTTSQGQPVE